MKVDFTISQTHFKAMPGSVWCQEQHPVKCNVTNEGWKKTPQSKVKQSIHRSCNNDSNKQSWQLPVQMKITSAIPGDISFICNNLPKVHVWKLLHDKIFYCKVVHLTLEINLNNISNLTSNDLKALTNSSTSLCEYLPFVHTYT